MKKTITMIFCMLIAVTATGSLSGCGCSDRAVSNDIAAVSQSADPSEDIVGDWGGRTDGVDVNFKEDGTCEIGGIKGTYEIDENNTLTVTPDSEGENDNPQPMIFAYYSGDATASAVPSDEWVIQDNVIYISGYQYTRQTTAESNQSESSKAESKSESSKAESKSESSKAESKSESSKAESKPSSSQTQSKPSSSQTQSKPSSSQAQSKSDSSQTASQSVSSQTFVESSLSSPSSESTVSSHSEGEEDEVVVIYQNLDDFVDM